jgi:hypothetical protein
MIHDFLFQNGIRPFGKGQFLTNMSVNKSPRLFQPFACHLRKILHRQTAMIERGFMKAPQFKALAQLILHPPPQTLERHPADEIRRELTGTLFGAQNLQDRLGLRLKRPQDQETDRVLIAGSPSP